MVVCAVLGFFVYNSIEGKCKNAITTQKDLSNCSFFEKPSLLDVSTSDESTNFEDNIGWLLDSVSHTT